MNTLSIDMLIQSASALGPFDPAATDEYDQKQDIMIAKINTIMLQRPDIGEIVGVNNTDMMKDNHANHARFIVSIMRNFDPTVLTETILWVFRAYRSHGFSSLYWAAQLNAWMGILNDNMPKDSLPKIRELYSWMQVNIPVFEALSHEQMMATPSHH
jgi:hypothetical protein